MKKEEGVILLNCPFCGQKDKSISITEDGNLFGLYMGPYSSNSECIQCYCCNAHIIIPHKDEFPKGMTPKKVGIDKALEAVRMEALTQAIETWNTRS
jgi:hypothetical protein